MAGYEKVVSTFAPCVWKLHEVTEKICKEKIESFVERIDFTACANNLHALGN